MIREQICTYEVCKLAKEKGFNVGSLYYYQNGIVETDGCYNHYNMSKGNICSAPTQSLLQRWLREEKNVHISINADRDLDDDFIWYTYDVLKDTGWSVCSWWEKPPVVRYDTYELALESALRFTLKNLI